MPRRDMTSPYHGKDEGSTEGAGNVIHDARDAPELVSITVAFEHCGEQWSHDFKVVKGSTIMDLKRVMVTSDRAEEDRYMFDLCKERLRLSNMDALDSAETFNFKYLGSDEGHRLYERDLATYARQEEARRLEEERQRERQRQKEEDRKAKQEERERQTLAAEIKQQEETTNIASSEALPRPATEPLVEEGIDDSNQASPMLSSERTPSASTEVAPEKLSDHAADRVAPAANGSLAWQALQTHTIDVDLICGTRAWGAGGENESLRITQTENSDLYVVGHGFSGTLFRVKPSVYEGQLRAGAFPCGDLRITVPMSGAASMEHKNTGVTDQWGAAVLLRASDGPLTHIEVTNLGSGLQEAAISVRLPNDVPYFLLRKALAHELKLGSFKQVQLLKKKGASFIPANFTDHCDPNDPGELGFRCVDGETSGSGNASVAMKVSVSHKDSTNSIEVEVKFGATSVLDLRKAICEKINRGPPSKLSLHLGGVAGGVGKLLGDSYDLLRLDVGERSSIVASGLELGPPFPVQVLISHAVPGAVSSRSVEVTVTDTATFAEVKKALVDKLRGKPGDVRLVQKLPNGRGTKGCPDGARLMGLREVGAVGKLMERLAADGSLAGGGEPSTPAADVPSKAASPQRQTTRSAAKPTTKPAGRAPPGNAVKVEVVHAETGSSVVVEVAPDSSLFELRKTVLKAVGKTKLSEVRIMRAVDNRLVPEDDSSAIGDRRMFQMIGCDLPIPP